MTQGLLPSVAVLGCGFSLPVCGFRRTSDWLARRGSTYPTLFFGSDASQAGTDRPGTLVCRRCGAFAAVCCVRERCSEG